MVSDPSGRNEINPFPYRVYFGTVFVLCLAGLAASIYLSISHYRIHTDLSYQSFCALSRAINCDTVSSSSYSVLWGLPVAVWGIAGYSFIIICVSLAGVSSTGRLQGWTIVLLVAFGFGLASIAFAGISAFKIGSYCLMCIATYATNFLLGFMVWIIRRRFRAGSFRPALAGDLRHLWSKRWVSISALMFFAAGLALTRFWFPVYWDVPPPTASIGVATGVTVEGHPWIGAERPLLEIVEFSDYQCFQCKKMHRYLRELIAKHPDKIRMVHRNYPMDHEFNPIVTEPFHVGSGQMALLAIHAAENGKFLEINDLLFSQVTDRKRIRIAEIAEAAGMDPQLLSAALQQEPYRRHLRKDIRDGMKLGITGTPSYLINGRVYEGRIPAEVLKPLIEIASSN